jgi:hypothetical protein
MIRVVHLLLGTTPGAYPPEGTVVAPSSALTAGEAANQRRVERLSRLLQGIEQKWARTANGTALEHLIVLFGNADLSFASASVNCQSLLPAAQSGGRLSWCSFALLDVLRSASIFYLHDPFTLAGEAAFALAKNLGIPCIIDGDADESASTGWKWGMAALADRIICTNSKRAQQLQRDANKQAIVCLSRPDGAEPEDSHRSCDNAFWDVDEAAVSTLPEMADRLAAIYCKLLDARPGA